MALSRPLAALAAASFALVALSATAHAGPDKPALNAGDERAVAYNKNVSIDHDDACTVGELTGTTIAPGKFTFTGGVNQQYLTITAAPAGVTVTGVVVKGSDAFNVYLANKLGPLPWTNLRSPDNNGGNIPGISHWYACGVVTEQPPGEEKPPNEQQPPKGEQPPARTETSSSTTTPATSVSTSAPAAAGAQELASTGFGSAWLVGLGAALLAAGAAVLLVLRRRRA
jgi:LPXTG-motif cell wall-anchored protein